MNTLTVPAEAPIVPTAPVALEPRLPRGADPLPGQLDRWLAARGTELIALRRHLHAHPELPHQEFETAGLVARELAVAGLAPQLLPNGNGVICDIGEGERVIALRADLDALPLHDAKDVEYRSTVPGVSHASGHDVHTAILLGAGLALAQLAAQDELPGRVRLLFQPAEHGVPSGAPEVISAGGLKDVASLFGMQCAPQLATGLIGIRSGPFTAATDQVTVTVTGPGGHTARPHLTADLVHALGRVIVNVPSLLHRRIDPRAGVSLVWDQGRAGDASNVIPTVGSLTGVVHILNRDAWCDAPALLTRLVEEVLAGSGAQAQVRYVRGVPPVINDRTAAQTVVAATTTALGPGRVVEDQVSLSGSSFACYLEHVPGALIRLGTGPRDGSPATDVHRPDFDVDEQVIDTGVRVLLHTVITQLAQPAGSAT